MKLRSQHKTDAENPIANELKKEIREKLRNNFKKLEKVQ